MGMVGPAPAFGFRLSLIGFGYDITESRVSLAALPQQLTTSMSNSARDTIIMKEEPNVLIDSALANNM